VLLFAALLALTPSASRHTTDDAFISFRCARNLATGHGPVYNLGQRVETFSNPAWVALVAIAIP